MAVSIQVEIEHHSYVDLCPAVRGAQGRLGITTLEPGQRRAYIKLFAQTKSGREHIQTIEVNDLPADERRLVPMQLTGVVLRNGTLHVRLYVEGKLFVERMVAVGKYLRSTSKVVAVAALVVLLLAGLGVLFGALFQADVSEPPVAVESELRLEADTGEAADEPDPPDPADEPDPTGEPDPVDDPPDPAGEPDPPEPADEPDPETEPDAAGEPDPPDPGTEPVQDVEAPDEDGTPEEAAEPDRLEPETHVVYFAPESAILRQETRSELRRVAERLSGHDLPVRLDGHTAIAGSRMGRVQLSRRRANAVRDFLVSEGVAEERFVELRALGAAEPVTRDLDDQDRNRRVEIIEIVEIEEAS